ncbi:MAG TPA: response regulator [Terriglobia bacterium]|nr:response regulator [Terriglobia bacterium]
MKERTSQLILIAGLPESLASDCARRLPTVSPALAADPDALFECLRHAGEAQANLLVLDHSLATPRTPELLAELRGEFPDISVIYCLHPDADGKLVRRLIRELGVEELLFHPVDGDSLATAVAVVLGLSYEPGADAAIAKSGESAARGALQGKLAEIWTRTRERVLERLEVLDQASVALLEGKLSAALREQAESAAHKLAGLLGTFGLSAGSRFARELELSLRKVELTSEIRARRFSECVAALRLEVDGSQDLRLAAEATPSKYGPDVALVVTEDSDWAMLLCDEASARGRRWEPVPGLPAALAALQEVTPAAVLVDIDTASCNSDTLEFLSTLAGHKPPVPAVILTSGGTLMDRVEVARRGGRGFVPKSLPLGEIVEAVDGLLSRLEAARPRVLAVDDDPNVLAILEALLQPLGIQVTGLSDPLRFWDVLEGSPPDLLLLDIQMPSVSGIELCHVVRNDPRWAGIPVIFLTAAKDATTTHRVFASGADDFVAKPIVGPELVTRITNRLERTRLLRNLAEVDPLSGLDNRMKSRRTLEDFLDLAGRHGQPMGLAKFGVDGLERINEDHGHAAGDAIVRELGRRLRKEFRSEEIAARWAGNKFVVGMYGLDRQATLQRLAPVCRSFAQHAFVNGTGAEFHVTLSGGVAAYPEDGSNLEGLRRAAAEARERAQAAGGNRLLPAAAGLPGKASQDGSQRVDVAILTGDQAAASLLLHAFESAGLRVRVLRNGLAASRLMIGSTRSLYARALILDVDLPGLDGLTLLKQFAAGGVLREARAILITSPSVGREAAAALELGAADHVAKPFEVPVLVERVRRMLQS